MPLSPLHIYYFAFAAPRGAAAAAERRCRFAAIISSAPPIISAGCHTPCRLLFAIISAISFLSFSADARLIRAAFASCFSRRVLPGD
jgi:hypothetical protein